MERSLRFVAGCWSSCTNMKELEHGGREKGQARNGASGSSSGEEMTVSPLTAKNAAAAADAFMNSERASELYCDEVLTGDGFLVRFDKHGSVSGLTRFDIRESCIRELTPLGERLLLKKIFHGA